MFKVELYDKDKGEWNQTDGFTSCQDRIFK